MSSEFTSSRGRQDPRSSSSAQVYDTSLTEGQCRVLILHAGRDSDRVSCDLRIVSLDDGPIYRALSYVWGDAADTRPITLCGYTHEATVNLDSALRHLRFPDSDRVLWVDALCINQSDIQERNHQVSQMGRIYEEASEVLVWLGPGTESTEAAIDAIEAFGADESFHWVASEVAAGHHYCKPPSLFLTPLKELLSCPWWYRVWTLQEYVLADNPTFQCGFRAIPSNTLERALKSFDAHVISPDRVSTRCCSALLASDRDEKLRVGVMTASNLCLFRSQWERTLARPADRHRTFDVLARLHEQRHRKCFDPRDRVYGFLGLASAPGARLAKPDYRLSVAEVFALFAFDMIRLYRNLDVFTLLSPDHLSSQCPTWVPDWAQAEDQRSSMVLQARYYRVRGLDTSFPTDPPVLLNLFDSSKGTSPEVSLATNRTLSVKGVICDTVLRTGEHWSDWTAASSWQSTLDIQKDTDIPSFIGGDRKDAFHRTLLGFATDICELGQPIPEWFPAYLGALSMIGIVQQNQNQSAPASSDGLPSLEQARANAEWMLRYAAQQLNRRRPAHKHVHMFELMHRIDLVAERRRLIVSERGYVGVAHNAAEPGDHIAILFGGRVPFILRKRSVQVTGVDGDRHPCYQIIGGSYVHGLMQGEGMAMLDGGEVAAQTFYLV